MKPSGEMEEQSTGSGCVPVAPEGPPIFVVGNGRAGTTLLRLMLCAHPRIYICHEASFYVWDRLFPRRKNGEELAEFFFRTFSFRFLELDPDEVLARVPRPLERWRGGELFRAVMQQKAARYGRPRYGDKTPAHTGALDRLFRDFPDARVIHIVRDPRATLLSLSRMPWASACDLANGLAYESEYRQARRHLDRMLHLRLEDLLAHPREQMERVLGWVGEDWDDAVLDHATHLPDAHDMPDVPWLSTARRPRGGPTQQWEKMSSLRIRLIEHLCRRSLKAWGYARAQLDDRPSWLRVRLEALRQVPEAIRFAWIYLRIAARNRRSSTLGDEKTRRSFRRLNPGAWEHYPGLKMPEPPPLPASRAEKAR